MHVAANWQRCDLASRRGCESVSVFDRRSMYAAGRPSKRPGKLSILCLERVAVAVAWRWHGGAWLRTSLGFMRSTVRSVDRERTCVFHAGSCCFLRSVFVWIFVNLRMYVRHCISDVRPPIKRPRTWLKRFQRRSPSWWIKVWTSSIEHISSVLVSYPLCESGHGKILIVLHCSFTDHLGELNPPERTETLHQWVVESLTEIIVVLEPLAAGRIQTSVILSSQDRLSRRANSSTNFRKRSSLDGRWFLYECDTLKLCLYLVIWCDFQARIDIIILKLSSLCGKLAKWSQRRGAQGTV